jgi:hypothetical protein
LPGRSPRHRDSVAIDKVQTGLALLVDDDVDD